MAVSGFEGFEKRLELHFSGDDPVGLRQLDFRSLEAVLRLVQCTVVAAVGNRWFDSYVLSESSLFVYPNKIIIKTCGTTQLLKSVRPFVEHALHLGFSLCGCRYTRGSFIFPKSQPYPHTSFEEEVLYLEANLPRSLCSRKATLMASDLSSHSWHVFTASDDSELAIESLYTIEVCMTDLDRARAEKFYRRKGCNGDSEMTAETGVAEINPSALLCDVAFYPCGYSMNGIDGERYSTIHVTPEEGYSYASFECVGSAACGGSVGDYLVEVLQKAARVFRPAVLSVATTFTRGQMGRHVAAALEPIGWECKSFMEEDFPAFGGVVFQTFVPRRK
ncbi:Adenosylmethionine decarboxylase [Bertholletia excelsa]